MARTKSESTREIKGLRDLTQDERDDIDALCDDGLMPSQIGRQLGIPTRVCGDARRAWMRQRELDEQANPPSPAAPTHPQLTSDALAQLSALTQQQLQTTLLQAQIDAMVEQNRHRMIANKLEERERALELREREAAFWDEHPAAGNDTPQLDEYDFENNPLGAVMKFAKDLKVKNETSPDAIRSPQSPSGLDPTKPLSDEQIAAYMAVQKPQLVGKALAAVGTPYQKDLEDAIRTQIAPGITDENVVRIVTWLKAEKKRRNVG